MKEILDGASHTMLVIEDAGRPQHWTREGLRTGNNDNHCASADVNQGVTSGGAWADPRNDIPLHGFTSDGLRCPGDCAVNCTNNNEAFSFHIGALKWYCWTVAFISYQRTLNCTFTPPWSLAMGKSEPRSWIAEPNRKHRSFDFALGELASVPLRANLAFDARQFRRGREDMRSGVTASTAIVARQVWQL